MEVFRGRSSFLSSRSQRRKHRQIGQWRQTRGHRETSNPRKMSPRRRCCPSPHGSRSDTSRSEEVSIGRPWGAAEMSYVIALESVIGIAGYGSSKAIDAWDLLLNGWILGRIEEAGFTLCLPSFLERISSFQWQDVSALTAFFAMMALCLAPLSYN